MYFDQFQQIFLRGHLITQIKIRFRIREPKKILDFIKKSLENIKISYESKTRMALVNEKEDIVIKAKTGQKTITLITIIPLDQYSFYNCHPEKFEKIPEQDYSNYSLIFAGTDLQKTNILR